MLNKNNDTLPLLALMAFLLLLLMLLFTSCSCEALQKKLIRKCGYVQNDTMIVHDTVITRSVKTDTIFKYYTRDTVVIREGKLVMKYFYNSHDSTVYLNGNCKSDTIYVEKKVPFEKTIVKIDYFPKWLMWCIIALVICAIVFRILK